MMRSVAKLECLTEEPPRPRAVLFVLMLIVVTLLASMLTRAEASLATYATLEPAFVAVDAPAEQSGPEDGMKLAAVDKFEDPGDDQATLVEPIPPMEVPAPQLPTSSLVVASPSAHAADLFRPPIL